LKEEFRYSVNNVSYYAANIHFLEELPSFEDETQYFGEKMIFLGLKSIVFVKKNVFWQG